MKITIQTDKRIETEEDWIEFDKEIEGYSLLAAQKAHILPPVFVAAKAEQFFDALMLRVASENEMKNKGEMKPEEIRAELLLFLFEALEHFIKTKKVI